MAYADKTITCVECGTDFVHSAAEQEKLHSLGYTNEPKRCPPCRAARKAAGGGRSGGGGGYGGGGGGGGFGGGPRQTFKAICAECGKEADLPFQPRGDRPVYCRDCFSKRR